VRQSVEIAALEKKVEQGVQAFKEIEGRIEEKVAVEKENIRRELSGKPAYSISDYLQDGVQPYSYGAVRLRNAILSEKPWMERLQDLKSEISGMPPFWHERDIAYSKNIADVLAIEAREGPLSLELQGEGRKEIYECVMKDLKGLASSK